MTKTKMNQDQLYQYLLTHNLTVKRLGELIGQSDVQMSNAFKHNIVNGKPHRFPDFVVDRINEALPRMADEITDRLMRFHPENNISKMPGRCYDPSCLDQLRRVGKYFNVKGLTARILGWSRSKENAIFCSSHSNYGHVTEADVTAINTELLAVAGVLRNIEIIHSSGETPVPVQPSPSEKKEKKGTRTRMEQSF